ncbi:MAG TPA: hypothetical protein VF782_14925 [Allosphingosinicella sp.]|jgi:hypothetical protein
MADETGKSGRANTGGFWDALREELQSPWDWVAAGVGATAGFVASATVLHTDGGTSIGAGALTGVTARKASVAGLSGWFLNRRTKKFLELLDESAGLPGARQPELKALRGEVERDWELVRRKICPLTDYGAILDDHIARFRNLG